MKIAVFLPNWIGDAVMATPALRAVRSEFADARLTGILRPYVADVLAGLDLFDRQILWNPENGHSAQRGWSLARQLRREKFDVALLLPNSLRSAVMAWLSGAKRRTGFRRDGRGLFLNDPVEPKPKSKPSPVLEEYMRLARHLGCRQFSHKMELAVSAADERRLHNFQQRHFRVFSSGGYVCLNPGGAFGAAKHWPAEYFAELARRIAATFSCAVLVLCGPAEREMARQIVALAAHSRVVSLAGETPSLGLTKAAIKHCDLLVTTDSGPRHFAPPFDVPVITLFGPTHIAWSETHYAKAVHLQQAVECGPCQQRTCPEGHHRCMRELRVERVFAAVAQCLSPTSVRKQMA